MDVVEDAVARSLAEDPHVLESIFQKLAGHEKVTWKTLVFDRTVGFESDGWDVVSFEVFCHFGCQLFDLVGQRVERGNLMSLLLYGTHLEK